MRLVQKYLVQLSEDANQKKKGAIFVEDDTANQSDVRDVYERDTGGSFSVAAAASHTLALGKITTVRGLYLEVDGSIEVTLNGADTALTIQPDESGTPGKLILNGTVTSVSLNNTGSSAVTGRYACWGDPAS